MIRLAGGGGVSVTARRVGEEAGTAEVLLPVVVAWWGRRGSQEWGYLKGGE